MAAPAGADAVRRESFNKCYTCLDGEGGTTARGVATTPWRATPYGRHRNYPSQPLIHCDCRLLLYQRTGVDGAAFPFIDMEGCGNHFFFNACIECSILYGWHVGSVGHGLLSIRRWWIKLVSHKLYISWMTREELLYTLFHLDDCSIVL